MSELGDIHAKVNKVSEGIVRIEAVLKTVLPTLATKDHVTVKIGEHAAIRPTRGVRSNGNTKKIAALISAIVALSGVIAYLVQAGCSPLF